MNLGKGHFSRCFQASDATGVDTHWPEPTDTRKHWCESPSASRCISLLPTCVLKFVALVDKIPEPETIGVPLKMNRNNPKIIR